MEPSSSSSSVKLSLAIQGSPDAVKKRYLEKISIIISIDPYCVRTNGVDIPTTVPTGHIVDYLLNHKSPFSGNVIRATKSIDAYKKFESGFVSSVEGCIVNDLFVIRGKVQRSMRLSEAPNTPCIVIERNGSVKSAHCNCPIGVTESCSHMAAVLYSLANLHAITINQKVTPTEVPAYWIRPSKGIKEDFFHKVRHINYGCQIQRFNDSTGEGATKSDFCKLLQDLKRDGSNAAVLRKFCDHDRFICNQCEEKLVPDHIILNQNILIQGMFNQEHETATFEDLRKIGNTMIFQVSSSDIAAVETCCGKINVEVKCPFRLRANTDLNKQLSLTELAGVKDSFIKVESGEFVLIKSHSYYYQIQTQIFVTNSDFGLFVVWSKNEQIHITVERDISLWTKVP